jgi:acyl carrier protein
MEQVVELDEKVNGVVADVLQLSPDMISDELTMKDVDTWDSLKHMELIVSLEDAFALQLSFEEIVNMQSVGSIKRVLQERGMVA